MSGALTKEQLDRVEALMLRSDVLTPAEEMELTYLKELARSLTGPAELPDNPATPFVDEARRPMLAGGDYLEAQKERSAKEREAAALRVLHAALSMLEPIALAALKGALDKGIAQIDVPPALRPVLGVVESAALDAARSAVRDVLP